MPELLLKEPPVLTLEDCALALKSCFRVLLVRGAILVKASFLAVSTNALKVTGLIS